MTKLLTIFTRSTENAGDLRELQIRREWEALIASAASPAERDEINDVFGRVAA
jgi:hypothetical protein